MARCKRLAVWSCALTCGLSVVLGCAGTEPPIRTRPPDPEPETPEERERRRRAALGPCDRLVLGGLDALESGRPDDAEGAFRRAIDRDRRCTPAYVNLGMLQRERGGGALERARRNLRRALAVDADNLPAHNELALVLLAQAREGDRGALDLAAMVCRQAQMRERTYAPIYNTWGLVSSDRGDVVEALRMFERARSLDPDMFEAHMNLGALTLSFRGYADAYEAYGRAVELRPGHYEARLGLGAALRGLRRYAEAQKQWMHATELTPDRPEAWFNLGVLHQDYLGGSAEALRTAKRHLRRFTRKAKGSPAFEQRVSDVARDCPVDADGIPRPGCRPGRLQRIEVSLAALAP